MSGVHPISHHPDGELLLAYGAGTSDEAMSLLVATHLAFCPACRRAVGDIERAGGALLATLEPAKLSEGALGAVLARLDEPVATVPVPRTARDIHTPEPLRSYLGGDMARGWVPLAPGIAHRPLFRRGTTRVRLIRAAPGRSVPTHTHAGREFTLVLSGGFTDTTGRYGPGDLQATSPDVTHEPLADAGEYCVNLAVTDAPLRFFGAIPTLVGRVFGF